MSQFFTAEDVTPGFELPEMALEVTTRLVIMGATTSRDWQPIHHDLKWAQDRAGLPNIILNNYTQAGWLSHYLTDWSGPEGRLGRMKFSMRKPICPGDTAVFKATVTSVEVEGGLRWLELDLAIQIEGKSFTTGSARLALPASPEGPSPWKYPESDWAP